MECRQQYLCCHFIPLMIFLRVFSPIFVLVYALISILLVIIGLQKSPIYFPFTFLSALFSILAFLYYQGLSRERDGRMIAFVLILRILFGFLLFGGWVLVTLSIFNLSKIQSLIDQLSDTEFLFFAAILGSLVYILYLWLFFHFYNGYRYIKKMNDRRKMCANESCYMKLNLTARPTLI